MQHRKVFYWRDKRGHEVDFVLARDKARPAALECKLKTGNFDPAGMYAFRRRYPDGPNFVTAQNISRSSTRTFGNLKVVFIPLADLPAELAAGKS